MTKSERKQVVNSKVINKAQTQQRNLLFQAFDEVGFAIKHLIYRMVVEIINTIREQIEHSFE